jgi:chemotaxis protein histidine kinase CheA
VSSGTPDLEYRLAALRTAFADKLADRLGEMEAAVRSLSAGGAGEPRSLLGLRDQAHKLAGAGGTFGFDDLGETAGGLEAFCEAVLDRGDGPTPGDIEEIEGFLTRLKSAATPRKGARPASGACI